MVDGQIRARGITDQRVLTAMEKIPRHLFVDEVLAEQAYNDNPLPIDRQQTISQPYIVALMSEAMELTGQGKGSRDRLRFRVSNRHPCRTGREGLFHRTYRGSRDPGEEDSRFAELLQCGYPGRRWNLRMA